jgi:hypothetical protein
MENAIIKADVREERGKRRNSPGPSQEMNVGYWRRSLALEEMVALGTGEVRSRNACGVLVKLIGWWWKLVGEARVGNVSERKSVTVPR